MTTPDKKYKERNPSNNVKRLMLLPRYLLLFQVLFFVERLNFGVRINGLLKPSNPSNTETVLCKEIPIDIDKNAGNIIMRWMKARNRVRYLR